MTSKLFQFLNLFEKKDLFKLLFLFFMTIVAMGLEVISIIAVLPVIREFLSSEKKINFFSDISFFQSYDIIYIVILVFISVHIFKFLYLFFFFFIKNKFINNLSAKFTLRLFNKYIFKSYEFHTTRKTSELIRNLISEVKILFSTFVSPLMVLIIEVFMLLGIIFFLLTYNLNLTVLSGMGFILLIIIYYLSTKNQFSNWGTLRQEINKKSLKISLDSLLGIKDIMIYHKENFFRKNFSINEFQSARIATLYGTFQQLPRLIFEFIIVFFLISLVAYLKAKGLANEEILEIVAVYAVASIRFVPGASRIIGSLQQIKFGLPALNVILDEKILHNKYYDNLVKERVKNISYKFKNSINFKNIKFSYENKKEELIFENLNLTINKKEIIGIFGPSGSGKSTLADLLSGLLIPTSGSIFLDEKNITNNPSALSAIFAYVPQAVYLFNDSIKNNIVLGEDADEERLERAIQLAQLSKFIKKITNGIETIVGERGTMLSGGQIQRIGIARAIYHKSEILIFDESTNALDLKLENNIMEEIKELKKSKTIIVISHKHSSFNICDKIYELKDRKLYLK